MVVRCFKIVYLRSSTISRTALRTRASIWKIVPWLSPSGESLPSFEVLIPEMDAVYVHMLGHDCHPIVADKSLND